MSHRPEYSEAENQYVELALYTLGSCTPDLSHSFTNLYTELVDIYSIVELLFLCVCCAFRETVRTMSKC